MGVPIRPVWPAMGERVVERVMTARVSRGQFMRRSAAVIGGLAGFRLLGAAPAFAAADDPKPIPGGFSETFDLVTSNPFIHVLPPATGFEMSTITDFNGVVAAAEIRGKASGSDGSTNDFDVDMRLMQGVYVGEDGRYRNRSFAFI
jgi:hypothetical protein